MMSYIDLSRDLNVELLLTSTMRYEEMPVNGRCCSVHICSHKPGIYVSAGVSARVPPCSHQGSILSMLLREEEDATLRQ